MKTVKKQVEKLSDKKFKTMLTIGIRRVNVVVDKQTVVDFMKEYPSFADLYSINDLYKMMYRLGHIKQEESQL